ncbi:MAG: ankyrin repeat domain-containing protein [bacterium]
MMKKNIKVLLAGVITFSFMNNFCGCGMAEGVSSKERISGIPEQTIEEVTNLSKLLHELDQKKKALDDSLHSREIVLLTKEFEGRREQIRKVYDNFLVERGSWRKKIKKLQKKSKEVSWKSIIDLHSKKKESSKKYEKRIISDMDSWRKEIEQEYAQDEQSWKNMIQYGVWQVFYTEWLYGNRSDEKMEQILKDKRERKDLLKEISVILQDAMKKNIDTTNKKDVLLLEKAIKRRWRVVADELDDFLEKKKSGKDLGWEEHIDNYGRMVSKNIPLWRNLLRTEKKVTLKERIERNKRIIKIEKELERVKEKSAPHEKKEETVEQKQQDFWNNAAYFFVCQGLKKIKGFDEASMRDKRIQSLCWERIKSIIVDDIYRNVKLSGGKTVDYYRKDLITFFDQKGPLQELVRLWDKIAEVKVVVKKNAGIRGILESVLPVKLKIRSRFEWDKLINREGMERKSSYIERRKILRQYKDYLGRTNKNGLNVLHVAAQSGSNGACEYILKLQPLLRNVKSKDGRPPVDFASKDSIRELFS